jgi:hypothetical protein
VRALIHRRRAKFAASLVLLLGLLGGLVVVGANIASGTNVTGLGSLDHFLCYRASVVSTATAGGVQFPQKAAGAWIANQFDSPTGRFGLFQEHCNPVAKTVSGSNATAINRPDDHLACWSFSAANTKFPSQVWVKNQFSPTDAAGNAIAVPLAVLGLRQLCLPSFKSLTVANLQSGAPTDLDHYACYTVAYPKATSGVAPVKFAPPAGVQLEDQFTDLAGIAPPGITVQITAPKSLCLPTIKLINMLPGSQLPTLNSLLDNTDHLVCFGLKLVTPATFTPTSPVFDSNQFGIGQLKIAALNQLCVPSLKSLTPPPPPGYPLLAILKNHVGSFFQGEVGAHYTLTVQNQGFAPTSGLVTVTEKVPSGLTLTNMAGVGWNCVANICTRSDSLASTAFYPPIDVTVDVSSTAPSTVYNVATIFGGGTIGIGSGWDLTIITSTNCGPGTPALCLATTNVTSSVDPSNANENVSFIATVTGNNGTPTGSVQWRIDGAAFGPAVTLVGGVATTATNTLSPGSHTIEADYSGDTIYGPTTGQIVQVVNS